MSGINREKIMEAGERICEIFEELYLTMDERAIVAYSAYLTAKRFDTFEKLEKDAEERPQKISKVQILTAVVGTVAVIVSIISILFN